jgi:SAM-dependent methyltransferase
MSSEELTSFRLLCHKLKNVSYNVLSRFGYKYNLEVYDDEFYRSNQEEGLKLAEWFVPLLRDTFQFNSLLDIGCGTGHYLLACQKMGIADVFGIEGSPFAFKHLLVANSLVVKHDLRQPYTFNRRWDLAISIEVAEHIDDIATDNYVKILSDGADVVVITAAPLGQGGTRHVNEHSRDWWIDKFAVPGYRYDQESTEKLVSGARKAMAEKQHVTSWFEPNVMVFRRMVPVRRQGV